MNLVDKVTQSTRILLDSMKDTIEKNIMDAAKTGIVEITSEHMRRLLILVSTSAEDGYQRSLPTFQTKIKTHVGQ
jgi:hypothetical protein